MRLITPQFVAPYRKNDKNDGNDAEAICESVGRPHIRVVPIKDVSQQAVLTMPRARQLLVAERTAVVNQARGLLAGELYNFFSRPSICVRLFLVLPKRVCQANSVLHPLICMIMEGIPYEYTPGRR